jgi:hypothetical protein
MSQGLVMAMFYKVLRVEDSIVRHVSRLVWPARSSHRHDSRSREPPPVQTPRAVGGLVGMVKKNDIGVGEDSPMVTRSITLIWLV